MYHILTTEERIEQMAERTMDKLDDLLMTGRMSSEEYANAVRDLDTTCKLLHAARRKMN